MAKTKDIDPRVIYNYLIEKGQLEYAEHFMLFVEETSQLREELEQLTSFEVSVKSLLAEVGTDSVFETVEKFKSLRSELEAAKKDNEAFKREFTEVMDDVARLGGENEKLQKEVERLKGVIQKMWFNQIIIRYDSQFDWSTKEYWWQKFKSEHNL